MKKIVAVAVVALTTLLVSGTVLAQAKPEQLVKQRQAAMVLQGKYFGPLGRMAQGKAPYNAETAKLNSVYLDSLSRMSWDGFKENTQGVKSRALPKIYSDSAKFIAAQEKFQDDVIKLANIASNGSQTAVIAQIKAVAKHCGGCHKEFRAEK